MHPVKLISLLLIFCIQVKSQPKQPSYLGKVSWRTVNGKKEPTPLAVQKQSFAVQKVIYPDTNIRLFSKKIDPGTITLRTGATIPVTNQIRISGQKLPAPKMIPAPPLQTRDNAIYNVTYTDKRHGFASSSAMDFAEDEEHAIWIGSEKGLIRYDGYHYYLYEKRNNFPDMQDCSLVYDQQKRLWWASDNGLFFIKNDSLFSIKSPEIDFSTIACKRVLTDQLQRVWIPTKNNGVLCIDGNTVKIYDKRCGLPGNYVESVYIDKKGNLYMACRNYGIVLVEPDKMRMFFSRNKTMKYSIFVSFYEDEEGIWAGSFLSGIMLLGQKDTLQYSLSGKFNESVYDIKKAPGGTWISFYGRALVYRGKDKLVSLHADNGLLNNYILKLFEDSFQNLWVSNGSGFSRINENCFYLDDYTNPAIGFVRDILPDPGKNGNWLVTFGRNLLFQSGKTVTAYTHKTASGIQPFIYTNAGVLNNDGSLWLGGYGEGIIHVNEQFFTRHLFSDLTDHGIVVSVKKDAENRVWFCPTKFGLILYDKNSFWRYTKQTGLLSDEITGLLLDENRTLYWTCAEGLQRIVKKEMETLYIGNRRFKERATDLLVVDRETRLLATINSGLLLIKHGEVYQFTTGQGLGSNEIKSMIRDKSGTIWIATDKGIESFRLNGLTMSAHTIYNESNGSYLLDTENVFLDTTGTPYWSLGPRKLILNKDLIHTRKNAPLFSFKEIMVDEQSVSLHDRISILPNQKIRINYKTIYWGRENNLQLTYLLISNQQDTTKRSVQNNGSIIISDILPGNYRILLQANDNNRIYYSDAISITVQNFWYNTWTFRVIAAFLVVTGIVVYFRQAARKQLRVNDLLEKKVHEQTALLVKEKDALLHSYRTIDLQNREKDALIDEINHRVKNNLQFISAILEMQVDNELSREVIEALLGTSRRIKAMSLVHELLNNKQSQTGIPVRTYIQELVDNLREMAIDESRPVSISMDIDDLRMASSVVLPLGMIISELVSNSFKHAFTGIAHPAVRISLKKDPASGSFHLVVSDNGNGYQRPSKPSSGLGSSLVDIFSRQLQGTYTLDTKGHFIYELTFKNMEA